MTRSNAPHKGAASEGMIVIGGGASAVFGGMLSAIQRNGREITKLSIAFLEKKSDYWEAEKIKRRIETLLIVRSTLKNLLLGCFVDQDKSHKALEAIKKTDNMKLSAELAEEFADLID